MARQAAAQQPQRQYLNVKHTVSMDGTLMPYRIDVDDENMRSKFCVPVSYTEGGGGIL